MGQAMNPAQLCTDFTCTASEPVGEMFVLRMKESMEKLSRDRGLWAVRLSRQGIRGSHPDDGWVDRERNMITPCYPDFWHEVQAGSVIALGDPRKFRLVRVWDIELSVFFPQIKRFYFRAMTITDPKDVKLGDIL